jgi:hypothetical protein
LRRASVSLAGAWSVANFVDFRFGLIFVMISYLKAI